MSATILFPILIILAALIMAVLKIGEEAWSPKHWVVLFAAIIVCVASLFSFFALRHAEGEMMKTQAVLKQTQSVQDEHFDTMVRLLLRPGLAPDDTIGNRISRLVNDQTIPEKYRNDLRAAWEKARAANKAVMDKDLVIASMEKQIGGVNSRMALLDSSMHATNETILNRLAEVSEQFQTLWGQLKDTERRLLKSGADSTRASRDYLARQINKAVYKLE